MPEPPFSRTKRTSLRDAIAGRQQVRGSTARTADPSDPSSPETASGQIDGDLLEGRVREEIARQLKPGGTRMGPGPGQTVKIDRARMEEAVRAEIRRQLGMGESASRSAPAGGDSAIDSELLRDAISRVLTRRLHRQGDGGRSAGSAQPTPAVTPALLEPLVRKELDRLLNRPGQVPHAEAEHSLPDPAFLRERIREAMADLLRTGNEAALPKAHLARLPYPNPALIEEQVRTVLRRCLSRPALPPGRPLSDAAIERIVRGALRDLPTGR